MVRIAAFLALIGLSASLSAGEPPPLKFKMQEFETTLKVGYAVTLVDVDGDGKRDIVAVDTDRVLWYRNPDFKRREIVKGATKPDNVCIDAHDINGDGKLDFALGADWKPFNTRSGGTLQWLRQGKTPDEWTVHMIDEEPTVHRIRFADVDGDGAKELVSVPLMGRGASKEANWTDGSPVRITAYRIPKDPVKERWTPTVLDESLHVCHNFQPIWAPGRVGMDVLVVSYDGVHLISHGGGKWSTRQLGAGNQENLKGNRGASEIKQGVLAKGNTYIATVEPWHGHQVVVYTPPKSGKLWTRTVIDDQLRWGHAVSCVDLDGDGGDELIIGVRDDKDKEWRRGVRVYKAADSTGMKWARTILDDGGIAVEDLAAADIDGDGDIDIVAVGRQTHNARIYWNESK